MRRANLSRFALFKMTTFSYIILIERQKKKKKKNVSGNMPEKNGSTGRDFFFVFVLREALPCKIPEHIYTV